MLVGIIPNPYEKRRRRMANRKRNIQMKFWVTEEEKRLIDEKMAQLPTRRYGAYLRKMAIDGYIIYTDTTEIKAFTSELSAIGRNINQIAKPVSYTHLCSIRQASCSAVSLSTPAATSCSVKN